MKNNKIKKVSLIILVMALMLGMTVSPVNAKSKVKLNKTKVSVNVGDTVTLKLLNNTKKVKWSSSNKKVVSVSSSGKAKALKAGKTKVYAKVGSNKYTCKFTVKDEVKLNMTEVRLRCGESVQLNVENYDGKVTWSSQNESMATVTEKGVVQALNSGTVSIYAKTSNKKLTCVLTIYRYKDSDEEDEAMNESSGIKTVKNIDEFNSAITNLKYSGVRIKTDDSTTITIPEGDYHLFMLYIDTPNAEVVNYGKFAGIEITNGTFVENTNGLNREIYVGNSTKIDKTVDLKAHIIIKERATSFIFIGQTGTSNAEVVITANGTVPGIGVSSVSSVTINGDNKAQRIPVDVTVVSNKITTITTSLNIDLYEGPRALVSLNTETGGENSTITVDE